MIFTMSLLLYFTHFNRKSDQAFSWALSKKKLYWDIFFLNGKIELINFILFKILKNSNSSIKIEQT
jgi:hypothetical protein